MGLVLAVWGLVSDASVAQEFLQKIPPNRMAYPERVQVAFVAFSPNGKTVASISDKGSCVLWDVKTGLARAVLDTIKDRAECAAFSPDGKILATSGQANAIRLWDVSTGQAIGSLNGHKESVPSVTFAPDGLLLSGSKDGTIRTWNAGRRIAESIIPVDAAVQSVVVSADGKQLATSCNGFIKVMDLASGEQRHQFRLQGSVRHLAFSPDGQTIAWMGKQLVLRNLTTGKERVFDEAGWKFALSPDGKTFASFQSTGLVRLRDLESGRELAVLRGSEEARSLAFSLDGKTLIVGNASAAIREWDTKTFLPRAELLVDGYLVGTTFVDGGQTVLVADWQPSKPSSISRWDVGTGEKKSSFPVGGRWLGMCPDGHTAVTLDISGKRNRSLVFWDVRTGKQVVETSIDRPYKPTALAANPKNGLLASGFVDGFVRVSDYEKRKKVYEMKPHKEIKALAFSQDGEKLATAGDDIIYVWNAADGKELAKLRGHRESVTSLAFTPDGKGLISGGTDKSVMFWDVEKAAERGMVTDKIEIALLMAVSPDGSSVAVAGKDHAIRILEVSTGAVRTILRGHRSDLYWLSYSPDGNLLVSGGAEKSLFLWDVTSLKN
jgi:WD40 repeat protein